MKKNFFLVLGTKYLTFNLFFDIFNLIRNISNQFYLIQFCNVHKYKIFASGTKFMMKENFLHFTPNITLEVEKITNFQRD